MQILVVDLEIRGKKHVGIGLTDSCLPIYQLLESGYEPTGYSYPSIIKWVYADDLSLGKPRGMTVDEIQKRYGYLYADKAIPVGDYEDIPLRTWYEAHGSKPPPDSVSADEYPDYGW